MNLAKVKLLIIFSAPAPYVFLAQKQPLFVLDWAFGVHDNLVRFFPLLPKLIKNLETVFPLNERTQKQKGWGKVINVPGAS